MYRGCCFVVVLMLSSNSVAQAAEFSCFERTERQQVSRIVGASDSFGLGDYPWMVNLAKDGSLFCGGSLINRDLVLTAAHCLISNTFVVRRSTADGKPEGEERAVKATLRHPDYKADTNTNDVALIRLDQPFDISAAEFPRMLPYDLAGYWGQSDDCARVIGWGTIRSQGQLADKLLGIDIPIWDNSDCKASYSGIDSKNICAGYKQGGKDSCQGDSGGPLFVRGGPTGVYLVGVVSYGRGCARPDFPGVYARVSEFHEWVQQVSSSVQ